MPSSSLVALAAAVTLVPRGPERILQISCGEGDGVLFLAREFPSARVRGVDPSGAAIRAAVSRVGLDPEGRVAFKQGSPRTLPYPDSFFDLVTQAAGRLAPGEIARVLRPGGHLILIGGWRLADRRLRGRGFELLEAGATEEGERFLVARLPARERSPE